MSAPDFATLYDFETQLEDAFAAVLVADGITLTNEALSAANLATPFASVEYRHAGPFPSQAPRLALVGTNYREDFFAGTLDVIVATDRARNVASHRTYRGKVRNALYSWQTKITESNLPYLALAECTETGSGRHVDGENNLDVTVLSWSVRFVIRASAWPT